MAPINKLIRFGRNPRDYNCAANQYLRDVVTKRAGVYRDMSRTGRSFLLKAVLSHLYNEGFIFVKQAKKGKGPWVPVPEKEARMKIGHLFRDTVERMQRESESGIETVAVDGDYEDELMPQFEREAKTPPVPAKKTQIPHTPEQPTKPQTFYQSTPKPDIIDLSIDTTPLVENFAREEQNRGAVTPTDFFDRMMHLDQVGASVSLDPTCMATPLLPKQTFSLNCVIQNEGPLPPQSDQMERFDPTEVKNGGHGMVSPEPETATREIDTHALALHLLEVPIFSDDLLEPLSCWSTPPTGDLSLLNDSKETSGST